jgi:hypothetical protein
MSKTLDFEKVDKALKEATIRCDTLKIHLNRLENDIFILLEARRQLEENISILKSDKLIAVASEFRKIKIELDKVKNQLVFLQIDKSNCIKNIFNAEKHLYKCKEECMIVLKAQDGKVIKGNFGKK